MHAYISTLTIQINNSVYRANTYVASLQGCVPTGSNAAAPSKLATSAMQKQHRTSSNMLHSRRGSICQTTCREWGVVGGVWRLRGISMPSPAVRGSPFVKVRTALLARFHASAHTAIAAAACQPPEAKLPVASCCCAQKEQLPGDRGSCNRRWGGAR